MGRGDNLAWVPRGLGRSVLALLLACSSTPKTVRDLLLMIDTDLVAPTEVDALSLQTTSSIGEGPHVAIEDLESPEELPLTFVLHPLGDANETKIELVALLASEELGNLSLTVPFTEENQLLPLCFRRSCAAQDCSKDSEEQTCGEQRCRDNRVSVPELLPWDGTLAADGSLPDGAPDVCTPLHLPACGCDGKTADVDGDSLATLRDLFVFLQRCIDKELTASCPECASTNRCADADINCDGTLGLYDGTCWACRGEGPPECLRQSADLNDDGLIELADFLAVNDGSTGCQNRDLDTPCNACATTHTCEDADLNRDGVVDVEDSVCVQLWASCAPGP